MKNKKMMPEMKIRYRTSHVQKLKINDSKSAYSCVKELFDPDTVEYRESFYAVFLNRNNYTIGWSQISVGGLTSTILDGRILFTLALMSGASGIILTHNHPSGNTEPSHTDLKLTSKLVEMSKLLDIVILDHIIITSESYYSFVDEGKI
ncbi:MAG: JAB domain-containing protein [Crocinitomicaceae bacterium]